MHEALRKHSIEDRLARLQAEKEVCEGMVHYHGPIPGLVWTRA